ncbi:MAG TPA: hypothetical protein VFE78_23610, partial [Gemmataceae bacterium]|nr:hypothetical protein [Gemmataceae bacterium]
MRKSNVNVALVVLLAVGLVAHYRATAGDEPPPAKKAGPPEPSRRSPWGDEKGPFTYSGRVVGPDGKPVAGAKLHLLYHSPKELPISARASSDAEGRFKFSVARAEFDRSFSSVPWRVVSVVAVAPGYGLGLGGGNS